MFYLSLLLPSPNIWRGRGLTPFHKAIRFYQKELTFPQSKKRFMTSCVGAMAKHDNNYFLLLNFL